MAAGRILGFNILHQFITRIPATMSLMVMNVIVFVICFMEAGSSSGDKWTLTLLEKGAQFNPLTLDKEWYRIFAHMFLHGNVFHLAVNMYALFTVGSQIESLTGTRKFIFVYFICGVASAFNSLYWRLFTVGVGASGAVFGLFGFALVTDLFFRRRNGNSAVSVVMNFVVFLGINLLMAETLNADNAAHLGGLAAGIVVGAFSVMSGGATALRALKVEYFVIPLLIVAFFALPRFQVNYYKFFRQIIAAEDSASSMPANLTDEQYVTVFTKNTQQWDSALFMLNSQTYLPEELASDTFKLRRYIGLRKQENSFKKNMIERESYIYLDSIAHVQGIIPQYTQLDYSLRFHVPDDRNVTSDTTAGPMVKVFYDDDWIEIPAPPASYYRLGFRDTLGRWSGFVQDYYENGDIQMKGVYRENKRDGVFLYYSDHNTYTSAGRYNNDRPVGKWEVFHTNGRLASEVYYNDGYFLKSLWDSLGNQLVVNGNGKEVQRYPNGVIAAEGEYRRGQKEGYWYGLHANGQMYFEEHFRGGRLISGRSRSKDGKTFVYDASSLFPIPEGGFEEYRKYVSFETAKVASDVDGQVRLSFRVTEKMALADMNIEKSLSKELDEQARKIVLNGPKWLPAKMHGHKPVDGFAFVVVEFK